MIPPPQDINSPFITTDNVQGFEDGDSTDFETVFVLTDFNSPDYTYLYKHENRIVGPPVVLHCAAKEEASILMTSKVFCSGSVKQAGGNLFFIHLAEFLQGLENSRTS